MIAFTLSSLILSVALLLLGFTSPTSSTAIPKNTIIERQSSGLGSNPNIHTGSASRKGVSGSCTYTWTDANSITGVQCRVTDTACDGNQVYAYVRVGTALFISKEVGRLDHASGCNVGEIKDGATHRYDPSIILTTAEVVVCVDDFGPDSCATSGQTSNPFV